jgi:hypothetical protein
MTDISEIQRRLHALAAGVVRIQLELDSQATERCFASILDRDFSDGGPASDRQNRQHQQLISREATVADRRAPAWQVSRDVSH